MGISTKLLFAFFSVIVIMVIGFASYSLFQDYQSTRTNAAIRVNKALHQLIDDPNGDFVTIEGANAQLAMAMARDPQVTGPLASRDRSALANAVKSVVTRTAFTGVITVLDDKGIVIYSTDSPAKSGYSAREKSMGVQYVLHDNKVYRGPTCFTVTNEIMLSSIVPVNASKGLSGLLVVSTPINTEFLAGLSTKFMIQPDHLANLDIALMSLRDRDTPIVAITPSLASGGGPFFDALKTQGHAALAQATNPLQSPLGWLSTMVVPRAGFEAGGRWWHYLELPELDSKTLVGILLIGTVVPDISGRLFSIVVLAGICGAVALLFAFYFSMQISSGVNEPLRRLIHRTEELANQRTQLPPLEDLSGEWLELGELIDTAVSSMRTTVQSLRKQLNSQAEEMEERMKTADEASVQLESMNRQYGQQSKQLSDISKQISVANRQAVLLQHKLDSVLQCSTEGFLILDQYGNVLSANPVFLNWIGANEGEIAGRLCFDLVKRPGEPPTSLNEGAVFARHGDDQHALVNDFYPEGVVHNYHHKKTVEVLAHLQPVISEESNIQGYIMVLRDKSLRTEIAQLRGEIVAMLSDSIRGPLVVAEAQWGAILSSAVQNMHPSVGQPLAELHGHYEQMLGVIDSLLMMYGGFVPPPVAAREQITITRLVADSLEEVAPQARSRQLALDYKSSSGIPPLSGNRDSLKSILIQILEKMVSITAPGGRVRVESTAKTGQIRIGISSSGPSLPESEITDMFVGFIQGKHPEASYSTRLSMYLTRNNVERLGGKIWAESEAGRGTVIYFILPVQ